MPLTLVGLMIGAAAVAASLATPGAHSVPLPQPSLKPPTPGSHDPTTPVASPVASTSTSSRSGLEIPHWVQSLVGYVCAIVGVAVVGYLLWRLIRMALETRANRPADASDTDDATVSRRAAVLAAVDASLAELASDDGDARAAVIACWVRLEEVAAAAGTPRESADSAADLVGRLLAAHQVSAAVLEALADLYRAARYGTHQIDSSMRARARAALSQLRDELARSRSGPLEHDDVYAVAGPAGPDPTRRPRPSLPRSCDGDGG